MTNEMASSPAQPGAVEVVPLRPRNAKMDALVRHASRDEAYSFGSVCNAVSAALSKAKATVGILPIP
jgi:hypothetical protein